MNIGFPDLQNHYVVRFIQAKKEGDWEIVKIIHPQGLLSLSEREDVRIIRVKLIAGEDKINWKNIS